MKDWKQIVVVNNEMLWFSKFSNLWIEEHYFDLTFCETTKKPKTPQNAKGTILIIMTQFDFTEFFIFFDPLTNFKVSLCVGKSCRGALADASYQLCRYIGRRYSHTFLSHSLSELEKFREITVCVIHVQCCLRHFDEFFVLFLFQES